MFVQWQPLNPEKNGFGVYGGLGSHLIVNIIIRIAGKLRRIILLHFGPVTFRINFRKTRKPFIFMVLGPAGLDHGSPNQVFLILETPRYLKKQSNSRSI